METQKHNHPMYWLEMRQKAQSLKNLADSLLGLDYPEDAYKGEMSELSRFLESIMSKICGSVNLMYGSDEEDGFTPQSIEESWME
jgi:hypothetical protein